MRGPALLLLAVLAILPSHMVLAVSPDDPPACKDCQQLCYMMDQMFQHEAIAGFYWKYAEKNPSRLSAKTSDDVFNQIKDVDFANWATDKKRPWPCGKPYGNGGPTQVDLETNDSTANPPCAIFWGNDELYKGDTYDRFTKGKCSDLYQPTIKHEEKHQQDCKAAKAMGQSLFDNPARWAQSEFEANTLHAKILRQEIRQFINSSPSGCGWQPTDAQKKDPNSIPSLKQEQKMNRDQVIRELMETAWQRASYIR
jgi:hypothetical protein